MAAFISLAGRRFGRLVALHAKSRPHSHRGQTVWLCKCDCGNTKAIARSSLVRGLTRSCGCLLDEYVNSTRLAHGLAAMRRQITRYRFQAAERGLAWELTESDCRNLFTADCHYCGAKPAAYSVPSHGSKYGGFYYNGIDRIDSDYGYLSGNVISACFVCNRAKSTMSYPDFIRWIERCASNMRLKRRISEVTESEPQIGRLFI
jgi:hypothetical protein